MSELGTHTPALGMRRVRPGSETAPSPGLCGAGEKTRHRKPRKLEKQFRQAGEVSGLDRSGAVRRRLQDTRGGDNLIAAWRQPGCCAAGSRRQRDRGAGVSASSGCVAGAGNTVEDCFAGKTGRRIVAEFARTRAGHSGDARVLANAATKILNGVGEAGRSTGAGRLHLFRWSPACCRPVRNSGM